MTNLELIVALLERHRYARAWDDTVVGRDLLERFDIPPDGEAAKPIADPNLVTDDEVAAAELAAHDAAKVAADKRAALDAQKKADAGDVVEDAAAKANDKVDLAQRQKEAAIAARQPSPIPPVVTETQRQ